MVSKKTLRVDENGLSDSYSLMLGTQPMPGSTVFVKITTPVGRCRFTVSKPVLKACLVSALETQS